MLSTERMGKFCYLRDTINANGGAESASVARTRCALSKDQRAITNFDWKAHLTEDKRKDVRNVREEYHAVRW